MKNNYNLAAIYENSKDSNSLILNSAALVSFDEKGENFTVESGYFKGKTSNDFNDLGGEPDNFQLPLKNITLKRYSVDANKYIYVFSKAYVSKYAREKKMSINNAYISIIKKLSAIKLNHTDKIGYYTTESRNNFKAWNKSAIANMIDTTEPKKQEKDLPSMDINEIIADINSKIVGQEEAVQCLALNIYYNQLLIDEMLKDYHYSEAELDSRKVAILLDGTTGTGKTAIIKEIANQLNIPMVIRSANSFSETGYVGPSITDLLKKLYIVSGRDINKAERGIVILDEVDKIASKEESAGKDMKKGVQEELLGFIGGAEYDVPLEANTFGGKTIRFDTSKLTFIISGAWTKLKERKIDEVKKKFKSVGFTSNNEMSEKDRVYTVSSQDYIDDGLEREFFGRIKVLTYTKTYTKEDFKNILYNSEISPLKNIDKTVKMFGYKGIICDEDLIDKICERALELGTGARGLQSVVHSLQNLMLPRLYNHEYDIDEKIILDESLLQQYTLSKVRRF